MNQISLKYLLVFLLGMFGYSVGSFFISTFILVERPQKDGIIEDWEQICFRDNEGNVYVSVSPEGCYSTSCTSPRLQAGTAIVHEKEIRIETTFVLIETSRFPLPCIENCAGGGTIQFDLGDLKPDDYDIWFRDHKVGQLKIHSESTTPNQCFDNIKQ